MRGPHQYEHPDRPSGAWLAYLMIVAFVILLLV